MKDTTLKIVDASFKLFLENNYDKVTVSDIEKAVGITRGAIFYKIKNKEELFSLVIDKYVLAAQDVTKKMPRLDLNNFEFFLKSYIRGIKETMEKMTSVHIENVYKNYFFLISQANLYYPNFNIKLSNILNSEYDIWEKAIENGIKSGELKANIDIKNTVLKFRSGFLGLSFEQSFFDGLNVDVLENYYDYCYSEIKT